MFHLVQINLVIYAAVAVAILVAQLVGGAHFNPALALALRYGGIASAASLFMMAYGWRWVPGLGQFIFPNISGEWQGLIKFTRDGSDKEIDAEMHVEQSLRAISFVLTTAKAESETLVVHPAKLSNGRYAAHYIYETRTKVGQPGAVYKYRGTAELRVEQKGTALNGSYYTEQNNGGTVHFVRKAKKSAWWKPLVRGRAAKRGARHEGILNGRDPAKHGKA